MKSFKPTTFISLMNSLDSTWTLYIHYPNDTNWNISSYKILYKFTNLEECIVLMNTIEPDLYSKCMFFLMRDSIKPTWEDPENINGGGFSYKVENNKTKRVWQLICYQAICEILFKDTSYSKNTTGITLSPKKNFSVIKIWTKDCSVKDPKEINYYEPFTDNGCIFKKHITA